MQLAIGRNRDRGGNSFAVHLYFWLLLNCMLQGGSEEQHDAITYCVRTCSQHSFEMTNHSSTIDQFILAIFKAQNVRVDKCGPSKETLHHHNLRFHTTSFQSPFRGSPFVAIRLTSAIGVIKTVLNRDFSEKDIKRSVKESDWLMIGTAAFYDCGMNPWPIAKWVEPAEGDKGQWVPLAESELLDSHVKDFPALLVRKVRAKEPPSPPALDLAPSPQRT